MTEENSPYLIGNEEERTLEAFEVSEEDLEKLKSDTYSALDDLVENYQPDRTGDKYDVYRGVLGMALRINALEGAAVEDDLSSLRKEMEDPQKAKANINVVLGSIAEDGYDGWKDLAHDIMLEDLD